MAEEVENKIEQNKLGNNSNEERQNFICQQKQKKKKKTNRIKEDLKKE